MQHLDLIAHEALRTAAGAPVLVSDGQRTVDLHTESGWCLAYARRVVEVALGWPAGGLYQRHGTHRVERAPGPAGGAWWARDLERSLREQGHALPTGTTPRPGHLLFYWRAALNRHGVYVGHVGVVTYGGLVAENVDPAYRPHSLRRAQSRIVLTPVQRFAHSTIIQLPA